MFKALFDVAIGDVATIKRNKEDKKAKEAKKASADKEDKILVRSHTRNAETGEVVVKQHYRKRTAR